MYFVISKRILLLVSWVCYWYAYFVVDKFILLWVCLFYYGLVYFAIGKFIDKCILLSISVFCYR